jgi:D-arabinose 1-dehydrogenase-like Zn-dependent alcohol dehydrogenase
MLQQLQENPGPLVLTKVPDPGVVPSNSSQVSQLIDVTPGEYARIDDSVRVEYPKKEELPLTKPVQGRGGVHSKRTLASFSLEGRVAVVTGGARGLGLVMAQALVTSGAEVALVDLNVEEAEKSAKGLQDTFKNENPETERYVFKCCTGIGP